ncbi:MAG: hypothetical protein ACRD8U_16580 [Pyrinomonadaceae bacterium]
MPEIYLHEYDEAKIADIHSAALEEFLENDMGAPQAGAAARSWLLSHPTGRTGEKLRGISFRVAAQFKGL